MEPHLAVLLTAVTVAMFSSTGRRCGRTRAATASQKQMRSTTKSHHGMIALSLVTTLAACSAHEEPVEVQPPGATFDNHWPKNWTDTDEDGIPDAMIDAQGQLQPFPR